MELEKVLEELKSQNNDKDVLELLWIEFENNFLKYFYYTNKISSMPKWEYFISDLDWTFFRWTLQKEAVSFFIKFVKKQDFLNFNIWDYSDFLKDLHFFNKLEKDAYNKQIDFSEYLNAWIFLILKHRKLINWDEYLIFLKYSFKTKEKINPFRFSFSKIKEVLQSWKNFLFVSWAPDFVFEIYLDLLKDFLKKNLWENFSDKIFWFWSHSNFFEKKFLPLWWRENKNNFIKILREKWIIEKTIWWMWDTSSDFWISYSLDEWNSFYFVNPEKKVVEKFDEFKIENIDYNLIIERKDLIFEIKKENIKIENL